MFNLDKFVYCCILLIYGVGHFFARWWQYVDHNNATGSNRRRSLRNTCYIRTYTLKIPWGKYFYNNYTKRMTHAFTWTKWLPYTWSIHITRCTEECVGGWLLRRKNVMLCWSERETRITLYLDAMTYPMLVIFIHLSMVTYM